MSRRGIYKMGLILLFGLGLILLGYYTKVNIEKRLPEDFDLTNIVSGDVEDRQVSKQVATDTVYPCGFPIGVYLETDGVMVIGTGTLLAEDGLNYEPALAKIQAGDYIVALNGIDVSSKSQLTFLLNKYGNSDVILTVRRNETTIDVKVTPVKVGEGSYKLGLWVRDDSQGIGTMTYIKADNTFGALGHGISDVDTGELLNAAGGTLYGASIWGMKKGQAGVPGGLYGVISYEDTNMLGEIKKNISLGIYGTIEVQEVIKKFELEPMDIAKKEEIELGEAYIRSSVSGEVKDYKIEIQSIDIECDTNKSMVIKVTDKELLELTNGIVQGMSGSPIIQNGRLIGAVTHVFVNDPSKGYGIFIETMLAN